jgi:type VI secretion system protein ImpM
MRCGLYGKIPSKRDFISIVAPRHFLRVWEPWLAACLAESRAMLGEERWRRAFCEAPAWRFVLDAELFGSSFVGVFTPSVDAIGRYFPLTLVAGEHEQVLFATPETDRCQIWFDAAEEFLLSVPDAHLTREAIDAGLEALSAASLEPPSADAYPEAKSFQFARLGDHETAEQTLEQVFAAGRRQAGAVAAVNYWWTLGSEAYRPTALVQRSLPDPSHFAAMLAEQFDDQAHETSQLG